MNYGNDLETALRQLLEQRRSKSTLRSLTRNTNRTDFSSNDFLSLSNSELLRSAFLSELSKSKLPIGSGGSRLLDGNSTYAENLEQEIADFHGASSGLLFNSGFDANAGFFACVPQPGDIIVYDELIHASVHDGMRLSRAAKCVPFRHNCIVSLREVLKTCLHIAKEKSHIFIAVEAVYSMDGDLAPLAAIVETVEDIMPKGRGYIVVDEAHATGVIGPKGRGLVCDLGLEKKIFARLHTFGKALACNGAMILGSPTLRQYLINYARPLIYTTSMSGASLAAIRASYSLLRQGKTVELASNLDALIQFLFSESQLRLSPAVHGVLKIPATCPHTPIFSVQTEEAKALAKFLQEQGFMVRAVVPPTVPEGTSRVRICLHAGNTKREIQELVRGIEKWAVQRLNRAARIEPEGNAVTMRARL